MNSGGEGFAVGLLVAVVLAILVGIKSYDYGHDHGVRAGLSGRYVVVQLPDGTSVVVEVKNTTAPKAN